MPDISNEALNEVEQALDPMNADFWQSEAPWELFRSDLVLTVKHTLTEPTCPMATIDFELDRAPTRLKISYHGDTVQEAIDGAMRLALARLRAEREVK